MGEEALAVAAELGRLDLVQELAKGSPPCTKVRDGIKDHPYDPKSILPCALSAVITSSHFEIFDYLWVQYLPSIFERKLKEVFNRLHVTFSCALFAAASMAHEEIVFRLLDLLWSPFSWKMLSSRSQYPGWKFLQDFTFCAQFTKVIGIAAMRGSPTMIWRLLKWAQEREQWYRAPFSYEGHLVSFNRYDHIQYKDQIFRFDTKTILRVVMFEAASGGNLPVVRFLLDGFGGETTPGHVINGTLPYCGAKNHLNHSTPLAQACRFGHTEVVRALLRYGAHEPWKHYQDYWWWRPHEPRFIDPKWQPLEVAVRGGWYEIIKMLVDTNTYFDNQTNLLDLSYHRRDWVVMEFLLQNGWNFHDDAV